VKTSVNLIDYYVTLINYLCVFLCVINYISSSSPHQPPLLLHLLPPPISTNQNASASLYKPALPYPQITPTHPLKPLVTTHFWNQTYFALKPSVSSSIWRAILQEHKKIKKLPRRSKVNANRLLSTIWTHGLHMKARRMITRWYMLLKHEDPLVFGLEIVLSTRVQLS